MSDRTPPEELTALEEALKALKPSHGSLDRGALLFRAGRASALRQTRAWRGAAAALALVAAALGAALVFRPGRVERVVVVRVTEPPPPAAPGPLVPPPAAEDGRPPSGPAVAEVFPAAQAPPVPGPGRGDYLRLRDDVVRWGVEVLPRPGPAPASGPPLTPARLREPSADVWDLSALPRSPLSSRSGAAS